MPKILHLDRMRLAHSDYIVALRACVRACEPKVEQCSVNPGCGTVPPITDQPRSQLDSILFKRRSV